MTTPEGRVKAKVKSALNALGVYYFMPVQRGMGASALDFYCCCHGVFVAIETKVPKKKLSPRQHVLAKTIVAAGGMVMVVRDEYDIWHMDHVLKNKFKMSVIYDTLEGRPWPQ